MYLSQLSLLLTLKKVDTNDVVAMFDYKDSIELVYADGYKKLCYPVLASFMIDYKEQVFITSIKANMQCWIYHVPLKEKKLVI